MLLPITIIAHLFISMIVLYVPSDDMLTLVIHVILMMKY